jgi:long-subunit fatty acid transport protein
VDGFPLGVEQTGVTTQHVITESINWNPLARLYLQADFSYVLNQTDTPASSINLFPNTSPTVVNFRNDFWTITAGGGYIINDKTDLHASYTFYRANDYFNNSSVAVPYGMGATEHTASATLTRQLNKQVRLLLSYTYFDYTDETFGGHNNYQAHSIFSSLQFRF